MARSRNTTPDFDYEDYDYSSSKRAAEFESAAIKLPDGMAAHKIEKVGWAEFDVLASLVGKYNRHAREGKMFWQLSYYCHRYIGPDGKDVLCNRKMFDEPCPVCELFIDSRRKLDRDDKEGYKSIKKLDAKDRQLFYIIDALIAKSEVELFDYSYPLFGEALDSKLQAGTERNGYRKFWHPAGGQRVKALFEKGSMGGESSGTFYKCKTIELEPRDDIDPAVIKNLPSLDDCLVRLPYDRVAAILYGKKPGAVSAPTGGAVPQKEPEPEKPSRFAVPTSSKTDAKPAKREEPEPDKDEEEENVNEAEKRGIEVGMFIRHDTVGRGEVKYVSPDGSMIGFIGEDNKRYKKATTECVVAVDDEPAADDGDWDDAPPPAKKTKK